MIVCTTDAVPGRRVAACLGLVFGTSVRARHVGEDLRAVMENAVGGEVRGYTKLLAEARDHAHDRLVAAARERGADAIVGFRLSASEIVAGAAEVIAYGTAVRLEPEAGP